jgi:hypothetical protein
MTPQEREQFRMLMAASIAGRGWSVSNFGGLTDY